MSEHRKYPWKVSYCVARHSFRVEDLFSRTSAIGEGYYTLYTFSRLTLTKNIAVDTKAPRLVAQHESLWLKMSHYGSR